MNISLHKFCNSSTNKLQIFLIDENTVKKYPQIMSTKEEAGRRIRASRLAKRMTLADVHEQVTSISVSRLSNWEQGLNMIGVDDAKKLALILGVTPGYLLTIEDTALTPEEQQLIDLYRHADDRGQINIHQVAQNEARYGADTAPSTQTIPAMHEPVPEPVPENIAKNHAFSFGTGGKPYTMQKKPIIIKKKA